VAPIVSVIIPCYNEAGTISGLLDAISSQSFPGDRLEIIVSDGLSTDGTRAILQEYSLRYPVPKLTIVDNPERSIPSAMNKAIERAGGEVVIRLDAHSLPAADYIARCVEVLQETKAANVGGVWEIRPASPTWVARSIASAVSHPLGAGDAGYRGSGKAGPVDTVPFGAFDRQWMDRVGRFNEALLTNEDYEYNYRIRSMGGTVWLDPTIRCVYFSKPDLASLARQYWRYGLWKARMLTTFPRSLRWRQAVPPLFVGVLILLAAASTFSPIARAALGALCSFYVLTMLVAALLRAAASRDISLLAGLPVAWATVHFSWGMGFLAGMIRSPTLRADRE
jgi:succinoglycan biosynthesis protein ExoA